MFCGLLPFTNRVDPVVLGMPFLLFWLLLATLLAPVFVEPPPPSCSRPRPTPRRPPGSARRVP
jgi:hypothetical protein